MTEGLGAYLVVRYCWWSCLGW